ncbi:MAG: PadR family transcriptional regulator [Candidatus Devosia phytovorans]|uniref:PadR family transcriptional regulator n=1 Tax=Candidatus Devosia phytovorans TaxID=3121372 RepID=A0AAJ5VQE7_9HYPH|nr:PadR family transcriptional regulator [Devosia sp.]WEK02699.1 MAG: PadR family transcriptional regulator [Devosia sp.]
MNVRTLCLSILYEGDATGYDIRRMCVEGECAYFVEASYGSIYPALAKLEAEKLVVSRTEPQPGKPAKKIYSITDAGRDEFAEALAGPLGEDVFRSPFLLFARYAHILPRDLVAARAQEFLDKLGDKHSKLQDAFPGHASNASDAWVINYGRAIMEVAQTHMRTHMHELITLARAEQNKDAAE